ncbi:leucine-rich repeat protein kinase family protein [Actinidia rufa]|uniref:Leucine-rich repeat protein kinase family protein n=1 Tax=Actinidia rufa TaxID=165716 RepID=A0A7J0DS09_9ERIC|nr:leucine-rich repeat protein kinase family protein [Actinidia rufa]
MGLFESCPLFLFTSIVLAVLWQLGSIIPHVAGSEHGGNETDRLALLAFKTEIKSDPFGSLNSWNQSLHFCQWTGVTCGRRHQRVIMLNLDDRKLAGPISPHIGNLSFLRKLQLSNNSLSHEIPQEIGRLKRLQILFLHHNSVNGEIPANISGCLGLMGLNFSRNSLVGKIPVELGSLPKLKYLYIDRNNLTGSVPPTLGNLSSLIVFVAEVNNISGSIPDVLGGLTNLEVFGLGGNRLVGRIPLSIFNLSSLKTFNMVWNQIQGSLPSYLGNTLPNLQDFAVGRNLFTGYIPDSLSNASKLEKLEMGSNKFTGKIPSLEKLNDLWWLSFADNYIGAGEADDLDFLSSLTNATYLSILDLGYNNLGGMLTESIGNLSSYLSKLVLARNKISGIIPSGMRKLVNLQNFQLFANQFTGNIPIDLWNLQKLSIVNIAGNRLSGNIPSSLENFTMLYTLYLDENNFHGSIPPSMGKCQRLEVLSFGANNLTGTIPQELATLSSLLYLNLSQNQLTGSVPLEVGNLNNLEQLDVSENMLSGQIPSTLGMYKGILDQGDKVVAVKVLNLQFRGASKSFIAECNALRSIRHRNLVKILTACSSIDYNGNDFKALVYEFMVNGSLEKWLHPNENENEVTRFLPKVAYESGNQSSSIGVKGSIGYAAPEQVASIADSNLFQQQDNDLNQSSASRQKIEECLISIFKAGLACSEELPRNRPAINEVLTQLDTIKTLFLEVLEEQCDPD